MYALLINSQFGKSKISNRTFCSLEEAGEYAKFITHYGYYKNAFPIRLGE